MRLHLRPLLVAWAWVCQWSNVEDKKKRESHTCIAIRLGNIDLIDSDVIILLEVILNIEQRAFHRQW